MWHLVLAGSLVSLGFAPLNYIPFTFLGLGLLLYSWLNATPKQAFLQGWLFGLGFFGVGVSWVFISINVYGNTNSILAGIITFGFINLLALFPGIQGLLLKKLYKSNQPFKLAIFGFPASWLIFEWLRSWILTGFPWLYLGYSQFNTPLIGFAPIFGVYGVSYMVILSTSCVLMLGSNLFNFSKTHKKYSYIIILIITWLTGYFAKNITWINSTGALQQVTMIQGNISPNNKFLSSDPIGIIKRAYLDPTLANLPSNLIIWPENSLAIPLPRSNSLVTYLDAIANQYNATFLIGIPIAAPQLPNKYYNALLAVGKTAGVYYKQHLVPFGEYLPFELILRGIINFFNIPMSSFTPGTDMAKPFKTDYSSILPFICYEIAYPQQVRNALVTNPSDVLLTISEDGWFGASWGPWQHLDIARMRAIENGRWILRSTTSGISAIIDPYGKILQQSPQFMPYVLKGQYRNTTGTTPWTKLGQWPILCFAILSIIGSNIKSKAASAAP